MEIEFDPEKAKVNPINHEGVTFEEARSVLFDPYVLTQEDTDAEGEHRFVSLGMGGKEQVKGVRVIKTVGIKGARLN